MPLEPDDFRRRVRRVLLCACAILVLAACGDTRKSGGAAPTDSTASATSALAPGPSPRLAAAIQESEQRSAAALPAGAGQALVRTHCLACHSAAMISQQRKDAAAWDKTVTQMMGWGSSLPAEEKSELLAYLVANFGPATVAPVASRP
jgi:cytochrome c5